MKPDRTELKCKYCDYKVKRWVKTKDGKSKSGLARIAEHVEVAHGQAVNKEIIFGEGERQ